MRSGGLGAVGEATCATRDFRRGAADNVAGAIRGVFFHEGPEMLCVGERGRFAVLDLHGDELSVALDHPVHFRACGIAPEPKTGGGNCVAPDMAEKFKSHELFELPSFFHFGRVDAFPCRDAAEFSGAGASQKELCCMAVDEISHHAEICNRQFQISPNFESSGCKFQQGNTTLTLDSSVECLTQRGRERSECSESCGYNELCIKLALRSF